MKKILISILALLAFVVIYTQTRVDRKSQFEAWKDRHGFKYSATEDLYRFRIYAQTMEEIEAHNSDPTQTYKQGENQFTAMTQEEFVSRLNYIPQQHSEEQDNYVGPEDFQQLGAVDWSSKVKVKDQGDCNAGWAFSAVGGVEAFYRIKKNTTLDLAEQQLIDCDTSSFGCTGGYQDSAIRWIAKNGILNQAQYPYNETQGWCYNNTGKTKVQGYKSVNNNSTEIRSALADYPLTVRVDATNWARYSSGVFSNCSTNVNHAAVLVGFNTNNQWIVKNSWGTIWGNKGFITLATGSTCGVTQYAGKAY